MKLSTMSPRNVKPPEPIWGIEYIHLVQILSRHLPSGSSPCIWFQSNTSILKLAVTREIYNWGSGGLSLFFCHVSKVTSLTIGTSNEHPFQTGFNVLLICSLVFSTLPLIVNRTYGSLVPDLSAAFRFFALSKVTLRIPWSIERGV
jgi:hypothetical protein